MKKILGLFLATILIAGSVTVTTWGAFADPASAADATVSDDILELTVDGGNTAVTTFSASNVIPGATGSGRTTLGNDGNLEGELSIKISAINNTGATGKTEYEDGIGNLGAVAEMAVYLDVDRSGTWTGGDIGLKADGTTYRHSDTPDYAAIDSYDSTQWATVNTMTASVAQDFTVLWQIPASAGNNIQGDSVSFDIEFVLEPVIAE